MTNSGVATRSSGAAASVGICSAWQMWHAVSSPLVCSCRKLPPAAKYTMAAQASSAIARREAVWQAEILDRTGPPSHLFFWPTAIGQHPPDDQEGGFRHIVGE